MADFCGGAAHPPQYHLFAIGRAGAQTALQLGHRWREDEDAHDIAARALIKLLRALPVDVEQHVPAGCQRGFNGGARRAIAMAENMRPFEEFMVRHHLPEPVERDEMIILAIHFTRPGRACGAGNGHGQAAIIRQQLARNG